MGTGGRGVGDAAVDIPQDLFRLKGVLCLTSHRLPEKWAHVLCYTLVSDGVGRVVLKQGLRLMLTHVELCSVHPHDESFFSSPQMEALFC